MGKFRIVLRTNYISKSGKQSLAVKFTDRNKALQINTGVEIDANNWDPVKQIILSPEVDITNKNLLIQNCKLKAEKIIFDNHVSNQYLTIEAFKKAYIIKPVENNQCFYEFAENEILLKKNVIKDSTRTQYKHEISKVKKFKSKLTINEVNTYLFFQQYENYMRTSLKNKTNTVGKTLKKFKALLQLALKKELIEKINVLNYKLKYENGNRKFLTIPELELLEKLLNKSISKRIYDSLICFLFACYTGLRYSDLLNLKYSEISNEIVKIQQIKTNEYLEIPLSKKAFNLLDPSKFCTHEKVFNVISNQKINDNVKAAIARVGIDKEISFHCSRHTFATISLNLGIPLNVVSKLLGHTDMKTTLIYAKLLENTKVKEMEKWDSF
jgi:integrase